MTPWWTLRAKLVVKCNKIIKLEKKRRVEQSGFFDSFIIFHNLPSQLPPLPFGSVEGPRLLKIAVGWEEPIDTQEKVYLRHMHSEQSVGQWKRGPPLCSPYNLRHLIHPSASAQLLTHKAGTQVLFSKLQKHFYLPPQKARPVSC